MAAKKLEEAIDYILPRMGEMQKLVLINELRDYFAHRTMILGENATALELFNDVFYSKQK